MTFYRLEIMFKDQRQSWSG